MSKKWITLLVVGVLAFALVPSAAWGACKAAVITHLAYPGATAGPPPTNQDPIPPTAGQSATQITPTIVAPGTGVLFLNVEGKTERVADVLVWDDGLTPGATSCFNITNTIRLTYNALLTSPTSVSAATTANFDVFDSAGVGSGLVISASSTVGLAGGGTPQTVITVTPLQKGTDTGDITLSGTGSAFRIKNLRVDATSIAPGATVNVTVSQNTGLIATVGPNPVVGTAKISFAGTAIPAVGVCAPLAAGGCGLQNSGTGLTGKGTLSFQESAGFPGAARQAGTACSGSASATCLSQVANDIATTATSFIFDLGTTLPSGVTVTWPQTISNSAVPLIGTAGYILNLRNTPTCTGPASPCFAIYDTLKGDTGSVATVTIDTTTGATAPNGVPTTATNPTVGVQIGSTSGSGAVTAHVFMGPGEAANAGCADDDIQAAAIPRYLALCTGATAPTRNILSGTWFTITSNQTALLYPYVTNLFNYQTGIVVSNTSSDGTVFSPVTGKQKGGLKFYFFPTNGTAFTLNTDTTTGGVGAPAGTRGLDANGQLASGGIFAAGVNQLLTAAGQPAGTSFDGYIIVVAGFQFAHGQVAVISPNGTAAYSNTLVIPGAGGARAVPELLHQ